MNLPAESEIGDYESPKSGNQLCQKPAICMLHITPLLLPDVAALRAGLFSGRLKLIGGQFLHSSLTCMIIVWTG